MSEFPDMSGAYEIKAPAKTNLWLRVVGKREDGFHEINTRMVALTLADQLKLKWREDDRVALQCSDESLPTGEENLVVKAVRALEAKAGKTLAVSIDLQKHIPSGAGLGGGSSDAAAVLRALNEMAALNYSEEILAEVGATIGSDVPFFVYNRPCDCGGRGEIVTPVKEPTPKLNLLLIKPDFGIAAAWAYQRWASSGEYKGFRYESQKMEWGELVNDLERPVYEKFPVLGDMKSWLLDRDEVAGALL
ncbi:MAG: 4-(cytidine 5'-diphospho)-2-C-methyl-D-erythritol kinase, partial [Verrucomicrobiota bacterium]